MLFCHIKKIHKKMVDLLLKDNVSKKMQEMHNLTEMGESFLYNNIFELNKNGYNLSVESLTSETTKYWETQGFVVDNLFYDQIINQFNLLPQK